MTAEKQSTKKGGRKGKAASGKELSETDWLTGERVRKILSDPQAPRRVKAKLEDLTYRLYAETNSFSEVTPDSCAADFINGTASLIVTPDEAARAIHDEIVRLAERHEPEEYKAARRVVAAYDAQAAREGEKGGGCHFFMENYVDALMSESSDNFMVASPHAELFTFLFVRAAREYRGEEAPNRWTELLEVLDRAETEEGFDFEKLREERKRRFAEIGEEIKAEELAKPEPKDKLSDEWRYWKLRQVEHAFGPERTSEEYSEAWRYCSDLLRGLVASEDFWRVDFMLPLLPRLIIARQRIDEMDRDERRSQAAMRGAETRRKNREKATKKGGRAKAVGK